MTEATSPRSVMFTIDMDDGSELTLKIEPRSAPPSAPHVADAKVCAALLGVEGDLGKAAQQPSGAGAKLSQLFLQWLGRPESESLAGLVLSNARRQLPASYNIRRRSSGGLPEADARRSPGRGLPTAPPRLEKRQSWPGSAQRRRSISGHELVRPPSPASPLRPAAARHRRRASEPIPWSKPWVEPGFVRRASREFEELRQSPKSPSPSSTTASFANRIRAASEGGGRLPAWSSPPTRSPKERSPNTKERSPGGNRSPPTPRPPTPPGKAGAGGTPEAEKVRSPLFYLGKRPAGGGRGTLAEGEALERRLREEFVTRGGESGLLSTDDLATLGETILDLPRAVARLMAKRCLKRAQEAALSRQPTDKAAEQAGAEEGAAEGVSYGAFHAAYGRFVAGEEEKVRVYRVLKAPGRPWLLQQDIEELVWCVADSHGGLSFLRDSAEFLKAYVQTVTLRIMWSVAGFSAQRITPQRWRRSALTDVLFQLDGESDINLARDFFSYNHFYVIWCLFWELDEDEDSLLQKEDLLRYGSYGLSSRVVDAVWALRRDCSKEGMTYDDFVTFILAEEDKQSAAAVQYWFHLLDTGGDGVVDTHDMRYFYDEQQRRLESNEEDVVAFDELLNEFNDMVGPATPSRFRLPELQRCGLAYNIISALTNVRKYVAWEGLACEKAAGRASNLRETRDWDLFADREYRRLVEEEDPDEDQGGSGYGGPDGG